MIPVCILIGKNMVDWIVGFNSESTNIEDRSYIEIYLAIFSLRIQVTFYIYSSYHVKHVRKMRHGYQEKKKQNKREISRNSIRNEEDFISSNKVKQDTPQPSAPLKQYNEDPHSPNVRQLNKKWMRFLHSSPYFKNKIYKEARTLMSNYSHNFGLLTRLQEAVHHP
ncbi:unnamed protein product [Lactuca saligna]|uniref:Uncharacterized protein n=1 Tax=Lactuca saligna TaxID=75948 RepID=A0AA36EM28_LACSI|nr:unnamed protein product [Lactuca saligna]